MTAAIRIPQAEVAIGAEDVAKLLGCEPRTVLECHACKPEFPARLSVRPARWRYGDVLTYRDSLKAGLQGRRRSPENRSSGIECPDAR